MAKGKRKGITRRGGLIEPRAVMPHTILCPTLPQVPHNDPPATAVLCEGDELMPPTLLLGSRRLAWHRAVKADQPIEILLVGELEPAAAERIRKLDTPSPSPLDLIGGYHALRQAGLTLAQTQDLAPFRKHLSDISAIASLGDKLSPAILKAMGRNRKISIKHALLLGTLPFDRQEAMAASLSTNRSPGQTVKGALRGELAPSDVPPSPDQAAIEGALGNVLNTQVAFSRPRPDGSYAVAISWTSIGDLQGVLTQLGEGPTPIDRPARARQIVLELTGNDEFDDLFGHLNLQI